MNIIMFGPPGAGKGTQASILSKELNIPTVSTGEMIRDAVKKGTKLGRAAQSAIVSGELVPDTTVIGIVKERLAEADCATGFILDGFPRTVAQAEALKELGTEITSVISIEVPDSEIISRMSGRRYCPACGDTYHTEHKPSRDGVHCDRCGAPLIRRDDDKPEVVSNRLNIFHKETEPLIDYYKKAGLIRTVKGQDEISDTTALVREALGL